MFGLRDVAYTPEFPAIDFVTLAEAKAYIGISDASADTFLTAYIPVITQQIEAYCNTLFGQRTVTETLYPEDDVNHLMLSHYPLKSLVSVAYDDVAQTIGDFQGMVASGVLKRKDKETFPGGSKITVVYTVGNASPLAAVKQAALDFAKAVWELKSLDATVTAESVADVGSTTYRFPDSWPRTTGGVRVPPAVASGLAMYSRSFVA